MQGYKIFAIPKVAFHSIFSGFFLAIFLKRKLEKLHEIFVVPLLFVVFYFPKVFKSIVPSRRVCNNVKSNG